MAGIFKTDKFQVDTLTDKDDTGPVDVAKGLTLNGAANTVGVITNWTAYTSTWGSTGTAPAIGNGTITSFYRRVGQNMELMIGVTSGTTTTYGSGYFNYSIPPGFTIDSSKIVNLTAGRTAVGSASAEDNGGTYYTGTATYRNTTQLAILSNTVDNWGGTIPFTPSASEANNKWALIASVPILEWA